MWWPSDPDYLFAVAKLNAQLYWVTGLVSPVHRSYQEIFSAYGQTPQQYRDCPQELTK